MVTTSASVSVVVVATTVFVEEVGAEVSGAEVVAVGGAGGAGGVGNSVIVGTLGVAGTALIPFNKARVFGPTMPTCSSPLAF